MKKIFLLLLLYTICLAYTNASVVTDSLFQELDLHIENRQEYIDQKLSRIAHVKDQLLALQYTDDPQKRYNLYDQLLDEYRSYSYDSAFHYVMEINEIAPELDNTDDFVHAKLSLVFTLLSSGLFKESIDSLNAINIRNCSDRLKQDFYNVFARTYYDLADYNNDYYYTEKYIKKGNRYLDSALYLMDEKTPDYWSAYALLQMKSGNIQGSADAFNFLISNFTISQHQYAIATSSIGHLYTLLDRKEEAIDMLIRAAIADIKASTKETVALRNLAVLLQEKGDIDRAYKYIKIALDDATFYNARHRKIQVGAVLPIIEGERLRIVEKQKKQLSRYSIIMSVLSVLVILFSIIIFKQLQKIKGVRRTLQETNANLQAMNDILVDANKIKEEYIGYFFSINSEFIERLTNYQKTIKRKISARQFEDLKDIIKPADIQKERENLFKNFDRIFLKLFPHFPEEFNKLFAEEDRVRAEQDELLNTDFRIFALIRLGITDNEKLAGFLGLSVNTIYTYKTRIKQKALVPREEFYGHIMAIKPL